ncbi:unnamed protein product [Commensalibacter communis]|uniref:Uncharacterized protein n=1 Tax=Commensalibacter communis TaxID=2972786 RepID=A0A9W4XIQ0_9PROT|nr:hypothetical protein [Commensalibacter communis]CAI3956189.1 unnamed protein product [Commensalibacter communis]CAI3958534.1 unnamed protein product [Commensalibacter communis]CAI3958911.1 unnamed protein product [Commensalibacter communis]CAI3959285.1 unnamed protein product [Commensalibacter communis]CAI3960091.1 unnamed protein product [Commensalibacter communis]
MSFQNKVNLEPAKGWHGDFASTNVRVSLLGDGCFQAGANGVQAGSFVWVDEATQTVVNTGEGVPAGFVGRELTGVPAQYLEEASMNIPEGFMVTVYEKGEFLVALPEGKDAVKRGDTVCVDVSTGAVTVKGNILPTTYKYVSSAKGGDLVAISAWI